MNNQSPLTLCCTNLSCPLNFRLLGNHLPRIHLVCVRIRRHQDLDLCLSQHQQHLLPTYTLEKVWEIRNPWLEPLWFMTRWGNPCWVSKSGWTRHYTPYDLIKELRQMFGNTSINSDKTFWEVTVSGRWHGGEGGSLGGLYRVFLGVPTLPWITQGPLMTNCVVHRQGPPGDEWRNEGVYGKNWEGG